MALDPKQASIIELSGTGYLHRSGRLPLLRPVFHSGDSMKAGAIANPPRAPGAPPRSPGSST